MREPVKIAVVVRIYSSSGGGLERHAVSLVEGCVQRGHEVHLFAQRWDQPEHPRVHYHRVGVVRKPAWLQALLFHWGVKRLVKRTDYDIVLGMGVAPFSPQHVYGLDGGLVAEWLPLRYPWAVVRFLMMLIRPVLFVNWMLERRLMSGHVSWLITYSSKYQHTIMRWYGVPTSRMRVIPHGYDPARFKPPRLSTVRVGLRKRYGVHDDAVVLLFVAHNFSLKGLGQLVAAMPSVLQKNPRTWLIVVGKDNPRPFLTMAKRHGVDRRIVFTGDTNTVEEFYAMADVLVHPTHYDPFGLVCLEAMACGLPVIISRVSGVSDIIDDGRSGYVIDDPNDTAVLTDRICRLLDPAHRMAMGHAAIEAAQRYTHDRHLQEVERFFEHIRDAERPAKRLRASLTTAGEDLVMNGDYAELLAQHGLDKFETLMGHKEGILLKNDKGKRIFQLRLEWNGAPAVFYLKRHRLPLTPAQRLMRLAGRRIMTEGRKEWDHILTFHDRLLPTVTPVAMGERILPDGIQESFLVTRGLTEYEPLESLVPKHFVQPLDPAVVREKRALIQAVGGLTANMHWNGFYHRDYYSVHLMLRKDGVASSPDIVLIDLQRVLRSPWFRRRWKVKDLASIHFSSRDWGLTRTDKLRFLAAYHPLAARDRSLMNAIIHKTEFISRHFRPFHGPGVET
jgi:UDP-glucose:(heptosyl)LPS alpha-1,3-glucosyltransferase